MKKPSPEYEEAAQKLAALCALPHPTSEQLAETQKLRAELRAAFMEAFHLEPDRGDKARRFYERHVVTGSGPDRVLFHNLDFCRVWDEPVIVSQPYELHMDALDHWAWQRCISYTVANEWGYFHPGAAKLFIIQFDEEAVGVSKVLGKTRRDVEAVKRETAERWKALDRKLNARRPD